MLFLVVFSSGTATLFGLPWWWKNACDGDYLDGAGVHKGVGRHPTDGSNDRARTFAARPRPKVRAFIGP